MRMKKAFLLLTVLLCLIAAAACAEAPEKVDATQYSYEVRPVLSPFSKAIYVKTDNPDPMSFRLRDSESIYTSESDLLLYQQEKTLYADVRYEDASRYRVRGGYIFELWYGISDGGTLILQAGTLNRYKNPETKEPYYAYDYRDTDIKITCPKMQSREDWLIANCTSGNKTLYENLDAVQETLDRIAVYPRPVSDTSSPNQELPWPFLAASPYSELSLNDHYDAMFQDGSMLLQRAYPFILDSLGFPNTIGNVAKKLQPNCEVSGTNLHWMIEVRYNGESKRYGGAGSGGRDPLFSSDVDQIYSFDGSASDWSTKTDIGACGEKLLSYETIASEEISGYKDMIAGSTYQRKIAETGGTWIRVAREGSDWDVFSYVIPSINGVVITVSDAWVDGRYVSQYETVEYGATWADHPQAGIVVRNVHYTDADGTQRTQDVLYKYQPSKDVWMAYCGDFYGGYYDVDSPSYPVPDAMILTREQVSAMILDANTWHVPSAGLNYNGRNEPGSPFRCATLTYHYNNGREGWQGMAIDAVDLDAPVKLWPNPFYAPEYPAGQVFKAWLIDGKEYPSLSLFSGTGDTVAEAVWTCFSLYDNPYYNQITVRVSCKDGQTGRVYVAYYDKNGQMISVRSEKLSPGANAITFDRSAWNRNKYTEKTMCFAVDDHLIPLFPALTLSTE